LENLYEKDYSGDLAVDGRTLTKLKINWVLRGHTGFIWVFDRH
jgi:hypothetical protein